MERMISRTSSGAATHCAMLKWCETMMGELWMVGSVSPRAAHPRHRHMAHATHAPQIKAGQMSDKNIIQIKLALLLSGPAEADAGPQGCGITN